MIDLHKIFSITKMFFNVLLMAISPLALIMLIVAFIMFLDTYGSHNRLHAAMEQETLTATATITGCYEENRYCFADFIDAQNQERYGKLDWRYYPKTIAAKLATLQRGDTIEIRYAQEIYISAVILTDQYDSFSNYKGHFYDMGGIALVSWLILIWHPEVMLFSLVDDMGRIFEDKWNKAIKLP